jgi:hypothetical protein
MINVADGSTANDTDANLKARANHTGTQAKSTISDFAHDLSDHNADTLANLNSKVSDATLIDTGDSRLSDARTPTAHGLGGAEHSADTLANLNSKVSDATLVDTGDARFTDSRPCNNTFDSAATSRTALDVYSTGEVDGKVAGLYDHKGGYNATTNTPDLDTSPSGVKKGDAYTVSVAGSFFTELTEVGDVLIADQDDPTLITHWTRVNKNISFGATAGTACEGDDARLSDARTPTAHSHVAADTTDFDTEVSNNASVVANTAKVTYPSADSTKLAGIAAAATANDTDANLKARANHTGTQAKSTISDFAHALGSADHNADTLANLNSKISDATLIDTGDSRLSDDRTASGIKTATTTVSVSAATAPTTGQVLKATSGTVATWQDESGGGGVNDISFSYSTTAGDYVEGVGTGAYQMIDTFLFRGTTALGTPTLAKMIVSASTTDSFQWRLYDKTNGLQIAEGTATGDISNATIIDLGTLSNCPTAVACWEVQFKEVPSSNGKARLHAVLIGF